MLQIEPSKRKLPKTAKDNPSWKAESKSTNGDEIEPILAKAEVMPRAVVLKVSYYSCNMLIMMKW